MKIDDYARHILYSTKIEDKLLSPQVVTSFESEFKWDVPLLPEREKKIKFSENLNMKFPKKGSLHLKEKRGQAIHFFANHELLATEMMAAALLKLTDNSEESMKIKKGILSTIADEQKHFSIYNHKMNKLGVEFGDFPLNDFFWSKLASIETMASYMAVMAMTFEAANLDFALMYRDIFEQVDDSESAKIMQIVLDDEISHVALGRHWLDMWKGDKSMWQYYCSLLPENLSPARSKGIVVNQEARLKAGLDQEFVNEVVNYRDDFNVVNRKNW